MGLFLTGLKHRDDANHLRPSWDDPPSRRLPPPFLEIYKVGHVLLQAGGSLLFFSLDAVKVERKK